MRQLIEGVARQADLRTTHEEADVIIVAQTICNILHWPTIVNHCNNSNIQQKEEGLVSITHLFILKQ